jgi:hypothetical protein
MEIYKRAMFSAKLRHGISSRNRKALKNTGIMLNLMQFLTKHVD